MGKIIAILIAVVMLVGCNTSSQSEYYENMREVNVLMSGMVGEMESALSKESSIVAYNRLNETHYTIGLILNKTDDFEPPKKYKKEHEHYVNFIVYMRDYVGELMEGNFDSNKLGYAESQYILAKPLVDKFKGE